MFTTVLALVPMAMGIGEGVELRAPMAITIIGGLDFINLFVFDYCSHFLYFFG